MLLFSHKIDFGGFVKSLTRTEPSENRPLLLLLLLFFFYDKINLLYVLWKQIIEFINMYSYAISGRMIICIELFYTHDSSINIHCRDYSLKYIGTTIII